MVLAAAEEDSAPDVAVDGAPPPGDEGSVPTVCSRESKGEMPSPAFGLDGLLPLVGAPTGMGLPVTADGRTEFTTSRIHDGALGQPDPSNSPANWRGQRQILQHIEIKEVFQIAADRKQGAGPPEHGEIGLPPGKSCRAGAIEQPKKMP